MAKKHSWDGKAKKREPIIDKQDVSRLRDRAESIAQELAYDLVDGGVHLPAWGVERTRDWLIPRIEEILIYEDGRTR